MATGIDNSIGWTAGDLVSRFGDIPLARVVYDPAPGTATEQDLLDFIERRDRLVELVDGTLVEKTVGRIESYLAVLIGTLLTNFVRPAGLGWVTGADGPARTTPSTVRVPDVAYFSTQRLPGGIFQRPVAQVAPNLAVEVISPGNTVREMTNKLAEYFAAGVEEVWYVYPERREIQRFSSPEERVDFVSPAKMPSLILPGLVVDLADLFADLPPAN
jgi:Uma2 family endonuclease